MFKFLLFIVFFFLLLLMLMGFSVIRTFKRILFGSGNPKEQQRKRTKTNTSTNSRKEYTPPPRKKIIDKDEGEYVDYEEVKE